MMEQNNLVVALIFNKDDQPLTLKDGANIGDYLVFNQPLVVDEKFLPLANIQRLMTFSTDKQYQS